MDADNPEHEINNLREYATLKMQIKEMTERLDELKPYVDDYIDSHGGKSAELPGYGVFHYTSRTTYDYSDKVAQAEQKLKDLKKLEELKKIATIHNVSRSIVFKRIGEK